MCLAGLGERALISVSVIATMFLNRLDAEDNLSFTSRTMRRSTIRAKMYRSSSHKDVRYDGQMKSMDKSEGDDKTESAITCGGMRADGWGQYRRDDDEARPNVYTCSAAVGLGNSLGGQQLEIYATYKHVHIQYIFLINNHPTVLTCSTSKCE